MLSEKEQEIARGFQGGIDCAMAVFSSLAEDVGLTDEQAKKLASCLGVGIGQGSLCGALIGGYLAIGYKYGNYKLDDKEQKGLALAKRAEFLERFKSEFGGITCPELLKLDLRIPEQMQEAVDKKLLSEYCPVVCSKSINIIKEIL